MEKLKELFGEDALTFSQLEEKLKDNKDVKLANLATGHYVDKKKYDDKVAELTTAQGTITSLNETVKKFDGVDVEGLKNRATELETKYNTDIAAVKLDSAVNLELVERKVRNPKIVKAALDMSVIKLDGEKVLGLSEQLDNLKASDAYLFDADEPSNARVDTGAGHSNNNNTDPFVSAFMKGAGLTEK